MDYPTQFCVFATDRNGSVIWQNRRAYEYARSGSVDVDSTQFRFIDTETQRAVSEAISDACNYREDSDLVFAGTSNRDRPMHFLVRPSAPGENTGCLVVLHDPMEPIRFKPSRLEALYGLTRKESLVAETVSRGVSSGAAAEILSISIPTYRTHVQRILKKCGASNQIHLSLIISSGIACV